MAAGRKAAFPSWPNLKISSVEGTDGKVTLEDGSVFQSDDNVSMSPAIEAQYLKAYVFGFSLSLYPSLHLSLYLYLSISLYLSLFAFN